MMCWLSLTGVKDVLYVSVPVLKSNVVHLKNETPSPDHLSEFRSRNEILLAVHAVIGMWKTCLLYQVQR